MRLLANQRDSAVPEIRIERKTRNSNCMVRPPFCR